MKCGTAHHRRKRPLSQPCKLGTKIGGNGGGERSIKQSCLCQPSDMGGGREGIVPAALGSAGKSYRGEVCPQVFRCSISPNGQRDGSRQTHQDLLPCQNQKTRPHTLSRGKGRIQLHVTCANDISAWAAWEPASFNSFAPRKCLTGKKPNSY